MRQRAIRLTTNMGGPCLWQGLQAVRLGSRTAFRPAGVWVGRASFWNEGGGAKWTRNRAPNHATSWQSLGEACRSMDSSHCRARATEGLCRAVHLRSGLHPIPQTTLAVQPAGEDSMSCVRPRRRSSAEGAPAIRQSGSPALLGSFPEGPERVRNERANALVCPFFHWLTRGLSKGMVKR